MYFTDKDKIYSIRYYLYLINIEEPDYQGLFELSIECEDRQIFVLGSYETVHNDEWFAIRYSFLTARCLCFLPFFFVTLSSNLNGFIKLIIGLTLSLKFMQHILEHKNDTICQKHWVFIENLQELRWRLLRKSNEPNKMISMTIIAELVLLTLTLISRSACAFCFCQPSEPIALQSVIREGGEENEETE